MSNALRGAGGARGGAAQLHADSGQSEGVPLVDSGLPESTLVVTPALAHLRDEELGYQVSGAGAEWFRALGIEIAMLKRQPLTRRCLDWSERRHHLAGALGVALAQRMLELRWIVRVRDSRALRLTDGGKAALCSALGLTI